MMSKTMNIWNWKLFMVLALYARYIIEKKETSINTRDRTSPALEYNAVRSVSLSSPSREIDDET